MGAPQQTTWKGKKYETLTSAWDAVIEVHEELKRGTLRQRYDQMGKPAVLDEVVESALRRNMLGRSARGPRRTRLFYRGERFKTQKEACKAAASEHGYSAGTIEQKLYELDDDTGCVDFAVKALLQGRPKQAVYKGKQRKSLEVAMDLACKDHPGVLKKSRLRHHVRASRSKTVDEVVEFLIAENPRTRWPSSPIETIDGQKYRVCNLPNCRLAGERQSIDEFPRRKNGQHNATCRQCKSRKSKQKYARKAAGYSSYENRQAEAEERIRMQLKTCNICSQLLPFVMFSKAHNTADGRQPSCRICTRGGKAFRDFEKGDLKKGFAIDGRRFTRLDYEKVILLQGHVCAICKSDDPKTPKPRESQEAMDTQTFAIDHCHDTGEVRGLLCTQCNAGIAGMYGLNSKAKILSAAEYLGVDLS